MKKYYHWIPLFAIVAFLYYRSKGEDILPRNILTLIISGLIQGTSIYLFIKYTTQIL